MANLWRTSLLGKAVQTSVFLETADGRARRSARAANVAKAPSGYKRRARSDAPYPALYSSRCSKNEMRLSNWQRKIKGCSSIHFSLSPSAPAVAGDDASDNSQSNTGAFKFVGAMQPLKDAEQFVRIGHVKTRAVVAHKDGDFVHRV